MQLRKIFLLPLLAVILSLLSIVLHAQEVYRTDDMEELIISLLDKREDGFSSKEESHVSYITQRYKVSRSDAESIVRASMKYADPVFPKYADIMAVIEVESGFNPRAKSKGFCLGLMQLKHAYHKASIKKRADLFDVQINIRIAAAYLHELSLQTKTSKSAYSAYNTGFGNFLKGKRNHSYVTKITKSRGHFA